jgi:hypothetical protein
MSNKDTEHKEELKKLLNSGSDLEKGWKGALAGAALSASAIASPPTQQTPQKPVTAVNQSAVNPSQPNQQKPPPAMMFKEKPKFLATNSPNEPEKFDAEAVFKPETLHDDLRAISINESQYGTNMKHVPNKTDWNTAHGPLGLKPMVAFDAYKDSKRLQAKFPDIGSKMDFLKKIKTDPDFHNEIAKHIWNSNQNQLLDPDAVAYSWRYGINAAKSALASNPEKIKQDSYVIAFNKAKQAKPWLKAKPQMNPELRTAFDKIASKLSLPSYNWKKSEELTKVQPSTKWPGLLGTQHSPKGDDRRDTPIIGPSTPPGSKTPFTIPAESDYKAHANKVALVEARTKGDSEKIERAKKDPQELLGDIGHSGFRLTTTGAALNENMRADIVRQKYLKDKEAGVKVNDEDVRRRLKLLNNPKSVIGTKLHEDSHGLEHRLVTENKAKVSQLSPLYDNLLEMAYNGVENGQEAKNAMKAFQNLNYGPGGGGGTEHYARLINVMNDPVTRKKLEKLLPQFVIPKHVWNFKDPAQRNIVIQQERDRHYNKYFNALKRTFRNFNTLANKVRPEHVDELSKPGAHATFSFDNTPPMPTDTDAPPELEQKMEGGLSEGMDPKDFDQEQLAEGSEHEMEHTNKKKVAQSIAMDHLIENPDYYKSESETIEFDGWEDLEK